MKKDEKRNASLYPTVSAISVIDRSGLESNSAAREILILLIEADLNADEQITVTMRDGTNESYKIAECDSDMAKTFAECIINNTLPELSGEEGKKALEIVLKCIESSATGKRVKL